MKEGKTTQRKIKREILGEIREIIGILRRRKSTL